ncbi:hypothetical protein [Flagellimonas sp. GZD32]|uniref:hypothetical protein n=1 Tax=Flagellimonas cixiensis TaxID=3228750 RepID=UPI0035C8E057
MNPFNEHKLIDDFTRSKGMFCFVFPDCSEIKDPALQQELQSAKYYLEGYWILIVRKLTQNLKYQDFDFSNNAILEVIKRLPLLSNFNSKEVSGSKVDNTDAFVREFLTITIDDKDPLEERLKRTKAFLRTIATQIGNIDENQPSYTLNILSAGITFNDHALQAKLIISQITISKGEDGSSINLDREVCKNFDYQAQSFEALLNLQSLQQPDVKISLDRLFNSIDLLPLHNSKNYFNP